MASRAGFIVKNAVAVGANLDIAEPDALDYNLLGNGRFGVVSGCEVTVSGSSWTISVASGVYIVNDQLVSGGGQVTLPAASQAPRFDLIVGDAGGAISAILGAADVNPVFPDYDTSVTVFAAVMVRPGATPPQQSDLTDKRIIMTDRFVTAVNSGSLLHNSDPANVLTPLFDIDYNGRTRWDGDTFLERSKSQTLRVTNHLDVAGKLTAHDIAIDGDLDVAGDVTADNLKAGYGDPTVATPGSSGDLYRNLDTGALWVFEDGMWLQLSTVPIPAGFTMMSFTTTAPPGWLLVNNQVVTKAQAGGLWNARPDWQIDADHLRLPDARDCFFGWGPPGVKSGNATGSITLTTNNLPAHRHLTSPSGQMNPSGAHGHAVNQSPAGSHAHTTADGQGAHGHELNDPGHLHIPQYDQGGFICAVWGGRNKLDGLFNDASHTYNVEPLPYTNFAKTNISVVFSGAHQHTTDWQGNHTHATTISGSDASANHTHAINEATVGNNTPIDIRPPFMGVYLFVKT